MRHSDRILSTFLPYYQWRTQHEVHVGAPSGVALASLLYAPLDTGLAKHLVTLRGMRHADCLRQFFLENGFTLLEELPGEHLLVGLISRPWRCTGEIVRVDTMDQWLCCSTPRHARIISFFGVESTGRAESRLVTETRVFVEDPSARRRFEFYWLAVRPFSDFVRRAWLREAKKVAEREVLTASKLPSV